ncbi:MAG: hypothetical protein Q8O95_00045 [bacterium]|nr:hypothetical protein [bacterium]
MNKTLRSILSQFKGIPLAVKSYGPVEKNKYLIDDFLNFNRLSFILGEINDGETTLTRNGMVFLEQYYDLPNLAEKLFANKWYAEEYENAEAILKWLIWWKNAEDIFKYYDKAS